MAPAAQPTQNREAPFFVPTELCTRDPQGVLRVPYVAAMQRGEPPLRPPTLHLVWGLMILGMSRPADGYALFSYGSRRPFWGRTLRPELSIEVASVRNILAR